MSHPLARGLNELTSALTALRIPFVVGGSLASSAHGVLRSTLDGDLIAMILPLQIPRLVEALGANWYADSELIRQSIQRGRGFNLIHMTTASKFDCPVATPEDILLAKLAWYREGGQSSEVQWRDIVGILVINTDLDWQYVNLWAGRLRVSDLLEKAKADAQPL